MTQLSLQEPRLLRARERSLLLAALVASLGSGGARAQPGPCPVVSLQESAASTRRDVGLEILDSKVEAVDGRGNPVDGPPNAMTFTLRLRRTRNLAPFDLLANLEFQFSGEGGTDIECLGSFLLRTPADPTAIPATTDFRGFIPLRAPNDALPPGRYSATMRTYLFRDGQAYRDRRTTGRWRNQDTGTAEYTNGVDAAFTEVTGTRGESASAVLEVSNGRSTPTGPFLITFSPNGGEPPIRVADGLAPEQTRSFPREFPTVAIENAHRRSAVKVAVHVRHACSK